MGGLRIDAPTRITGRGAAARAVGPRSTPWIARIEGANDPKYGFKRRFCRRDRSGVSASGRTGTHFFEMMGEGLYEYRNFPFGARTSGFVLVHDDGTVEEVDRVEAKRIARTLDDPATWRPDGKPDMQAIGAERANDNEPEVAKPA